MSPVDKAFRNRSVMVVDNEPEICAMVKRLLNIEGVDVTTAADGQEALDSIDQGTVPDLILTDLKMPVMDGPELFARLKNNSKTKDVPVLIVSGIEDIGAKSKLLGASGFLRKPYRIKTLTDFVISYLH